MSETTASIDLSDDNATEAAATPTPADIRLAAMNLLARREHSVRELRNKLKRRFSDEAVIDEQISRLTLERLQSDARFAESYACQRADKGYGPVRLREELRERGVTEAEVDMALEELEVDWRVLATRVMQKKFGLDAPVDIKEKARRARFMQYRGFAMEHYRYREED
ncbi:MAG: regulatory protein RecX [Halioglobus sp.]|nr:regulatory protein RecX [Halioglobus sp.]